MLERFTVLARQSLIFARRKADERNGDASGLLRQHSMPPCSV